MTLPENFDSWEHLQSTILKIHNKLVRENFSDQDDNFDVNVPRSSLKLASLMNDNETSSMLLTRMLFFLFYVGYAYDNLEPYYGIPVAELQSNVKFKPQLTFYFREDLGDAFENDQRPIRARISKRLNETSGTITKTKLINLANKIKTGLCSGGGYKFKRGKELYTYKDEEKGYNFQLYTWSKLEAKEVINKIMDIFTDTPDWKQLFHHISEEPSSAFPTVAGTLNILGETEKLPAKRRIGHVRFQRCDCRIWGKTKPVTLVDRTGKTFDSLVAV